MKKREGNLGFPRCHACSQATTQVFIVQTQHVCTHYPPIESKKEPQWWKWGEVKISVALARSRKYSMLRHRRTLAISTSVFLLASEKLDTSVREALAPAITCVVRFEVSKPLSQSLF
eukprot:m.109956 g.109956  ORF g.109956 m.109956 type:complete len:117 (-) comp12862_c0_seq5:111-461(-)